MFTLEVAAGPGGMYLARCPQVKGVNAVGFDLGSLFDSVRDAFESLALAGDEAAKSVLQNSASQ
jgi:predicted RNase H-like HicB family nuclease